MIEPDAVFKKPRLFDEKLDEVKRRIAKLNAKTQTITSSPLLGGQSTGKYYNGDI